MRAVKWTTIAMLASLALAALAVALHLLFRDAIIPQLLLVVAGFGMLLSRAAHTVAAAITWLPQRWRRGWRRRE